MNSIGKKRVMPTALLIGDLYQMVDKWRSSGRPAQNQFEWGGPVMRHGLEIVSDLVWGTSRAYRRRQGPRTRYHWVEEHAPIAVYAKDCEGHLYCGFRGTYISKEWDMNSQFIKTRLSTAADSASEVHRGFLSIYNSMCSRLSADLRKLLEAGELKDVVFCGHSLGGALALLAAHDLIIANGLLKDVPVSVYLYGAPRVGNHAFSSGVESMLQSLYRFEVDGDIVPSVPLERHGYHHAGKQILLSAEPGQNRHSLHTYMAAIPSALV